MATIKYNGMELDEVTEPQIFDPPKKCVVWDDNYLSPCEKDVIAIFPDSAKLKMNVIDTALYRYKHCAILPEKPASRRATWIEVAKWCAMGNGLVYDNYRNKFDTGIMFTPYSANQPIDDNIKIRKWDEDKWHEPTIDYMGIET